MAKKPTLTDLTSQYSAQTVVNNNNDEIESAFENTISRDGSTPNQMEADFDLNSNDILNGGTINADSLVVDGTSISTLTSTPNWRGAWVTATSYSINDLVQESGNVYIATVAHTSGVFATDLASPNWELFSQKGDTGATGASGAGSGDLVSTSNLSDVADAATSRTNLGLGTAATSAATDFVAVSGDQMTGTLDMNSQTIDNPLDPSAGTHVGDRDYNDARYAQVGNNLSDVTAATARTNLGLGTMALGTVITTTTLTSQSTVEFTGFDDSLYTTYVFELNHVQCNTDNWAIRIRTSSDGTNYDSGASDYLDAILGLNEQGTERRTVSFGGEDELSLGGFGLGTASGEEGYSGSILLLGVHDSGNRTMFTYSGGGIEDSGDFIFQTGAGCRDSAYETQGVRFFPSSGTFASGSIRLIGIP